MLQNQNTNRIMIELLRAAVLGSQIDSPKVDKLDEQTLSALYLIASKHNIAHIINDVIYKYNLADGDLEVMKKFQQCQVVAFYRYNKQEYELSRVCKCLENAEVPYITLKGAVIRKLYPEPYMRTCCDIDILVSKNDCQRAIDALTSQLSFVQLESNSLHDYVLSAPSGVHLELHHTLIEDNLLPKANQILESVWENSLLTGDGSYSYSMSGEMFMYYHIIHMVKHFLSGGCGVRSMIDLWLLDNYYEFDRSVLLKMLSDTGLGTFYEKAIYLVNIWFSNAEYNDTSVLMEKFIFDGGTFGTISNSAAISAGQGKSKAASFFDTMFLPLENLKVLYPELNSKPYLYPIYQVRRWFRVFNKDRRNRVIRLTEARNSLSNEKINSVNKLLDDLNLRDK